MDYTEIRKNIADCAYQNRALHVAFPDCRIETIVHVPENVFEEFVKCNNKELEEGGVYPIDVESFEDIEQDCLILTSPPYK